MKRSPERIRWTDAISAATILLLGILLFAAGSGILEQWKESSARHQELDAEHLLGAAAAAAGAALVGWWFLGLFFACATTLLERKGKTRAASLTANFSPALMQRLVLGVLSINLVAGPAATAHTGLSGPEWTPTQDQVASAPATASASPPGAEGTGSDPAPVSLEDGSPNLKVPASETHPGWQPSAPPSDPGLLAAPAARTASGATDNAAAVTVLAGDTLWDVAAQAMGPEASDVEIATQWPRWYEANRSVIGHNPDVLLPGQILQPPAAS
jgi:hypothetical protein